MGITEETAKLADAVQWARDNGDAFAWSTALDNHEPTRAYGHGEGYRYERPQGWGRAVILADVSALRDATSALFVLDDGRTIRTMYVAGWHPNHDYVILHDLPRDFGDDGEPIRRADNGEPVSFGNWFLGPRRAYHLKVR